MVSAGCRKWPMWCKARLTTARCSRAFAFDDRVVAVGVAAARELIAFEPDRAGIDSRRLNFRRRSFTRNPSVSGGQSTWAELL
jgi:hypothetical protein